MGKNYKNWNVGDKVKIIFSHSEDLNNVGVIKEVRPSFCKIDIKGYPKLRNHTYGQFAKVGDEEFERLKNFYYYKNMIDFPSDFKDRLEELKKLFVDKKAFRRSSLKKAEVSCYRIVLCCYDFLRNTDNLKEAEELANKELWEDLAKFLSDKLPYYELDITLLPFTWELFINYINGRDIKSLRINIPELY